MILQAKAIGKDVSYNSFGPDIIICRDCFYKLWQFDIKTKHSDKLRFVKQGLRLMSANLTITVDHCGSFFKIHTFKYGILAVLFL